MSKATKKRARPSRYELEESLTEMVRLTQAVFREWVCPEVRLEDAVKGTCLSASEIFTLCEEAHYADMLIERARGHRAWGSDICPEADPWQRIVDRQQMSDSSGQPEAAA